MIKALGFAVIAVVAATCALAVGAAEPLTQPTTEASTQPATRPAVNVPPAAEWALNVGPLSPATMASTQAATQPSTQPAKELTLDLGNNVTMKLALIPAGKFMMGSPKDEKDRGDNESPQHEVTISRPFYMGVYTVTQKQYKQILGTNPSRIKGAQNPVETVSWGDAVEFCKKLSQKTGKTVSLPTEAQWEYACRAGSTTRFFYGDDNDEQNLDDYAWYSMNSGDKTHPVGLKKPNAWGLYDMHGNVWQWCADGYADSYANANQTDPTGPASDTSRVLRGGAWTHLPVMCRSASRLPYSPRARISYIGFRVVVEDLLVSAPADAADRSLRPAKELILDLGNRATMKVVLIPAGKFMMGSPKAEEDRDEDEGPQREVTISKAFYMGVYTVTQGQYEQITGTNPSRFKGAQNPVEMVSCDGAVEFCKKLSQKTGKTVRLPSEAEWEYACRAGSETRLSYGDDNGYKNLGDYAWYDKNSNKTTHAVGQKKPNDWGLYDMHGNVYQWCSDWYRDSYANTKNTDPLGPASGDGHVRRGGGWGGGPEECRSALRGRGNVGYRGDDVGFRVVVEVK